jgi:farnesyl-diphosphate farnesyltransferase
VTAPDLLRGLLKSVSRSIYLSLRVLPAPVRDSMGLAYLLCRAADTIADTRLIPSARRLAALAEFRSRVQGEGAWAGFCDPGRNSSAEGALLGRLDECFDALDDLTAADRRLARKVVGSVIDGMQMDFRYFPGEDEQSLTALPSRRELDRYCGFIGGGPGLFWTDLCFEHLPSLGALSRDRMRELGDRYGRGLQMTNILRDLPADLRIGRCYIPRDELLAEGLEPARLLTADSWGAFRGLHGRLSGWAEGMLEDGLRYVLALPKSEPRLKMACAWPLLLARRTLVLLRSGVNVLDTKKRIKVPRREVYRTMALSTGAVVSDRALKRLYGRP